MSAAAQDAALVAMRAAADRRPVGWILGHLREGIVHHDYRDHAGLLPAGSAKDLLPQFYARHELAQAAALEDLRQAWVPPAVDDAAWENLSAGWHCAACDGAASGCSRTRSDWRQYRLVRERQNRFLDAHPEYLEAAQRKAEADGSRCGS
jgi:hypothetical protein